MRAKAWRALQSKEREAGRCAALFMGVRLLSKKACPATQESDQYSYLVLGFRESQIEFAADLTTIRNQDGISDTMALEALGDDWLTFPMVHAVGISVAQDTDITMTPRRYLCTDVVTRVPTGLSSTHIRAVSS